MSDHFGKIISEMEKIAYDRNCFISLCSSRNDEQFINLVYEHFFDGILIGSITLSEENIQRLVDTGIPIVLLENRDYSMITGIYGKIDTGIYTGARQCVKALYEKGRRNLLYVDRMDTESGQPVHIDYRYNGFFDQLKEYNIKHNISQVVYGYKSEDELRRKLFQYIKDEQKVPDGIMCFTDDVACMVMEIVKDMGYHIPLDISIIGFNNSKIGRYTSPTLSSVEIPRGEIGKSAMKILTELIDHKEDVISPIVEKLKTRLVIRESI
jgi:DNA-binding LacI/PurR family transcriptional regulator